MLEENIKFILNIYAFENQGADYFTFSSILFLLFFFSFLLPTLPTELVVRNISIKAKNVNLR